VKSQIEREVEETNLWISVECL